MPYAGQSIKRFEDHRLLTGKGSFVDDLSPPGVLHAVVLRSPHAHAKIITIDTGAASRLPGVVSVITAADIQDLAGQIPTRPSADADEIVPPRHPILAVDRVCYVGQAVAVVVADNPYAAEEALEQVQVSYEVLPAVIDPLTATDADTPLVHPDLQGNVSLRTISSGGDLDAAFSQAEHVVRDVYHVQRLAPDPMEPRAVLADYQAP